LNIMMKCPEGSGASFRLGDKAEHVQKCECCHLRAFDEERKKALNEVASDGWTLPRAAADQGHDQNLARLSEAMAEVNTAYTDDREQGMLRLLAAMRPVTRHMLGTMRRDN